MRLPAVVVLALAFIAPSLAASQEALSAAPMSWHGAQMGPEQLFEGDYSVDYQTSLFRPDGGTAEALWLAGWEDRPGDNGALGRRYRLRFVGRRTVEPGKYGGLGAYKHTVLITRLLSARLLIGN